MSNNALTLFNYNGSQVRTILDERTGEPWWVAKDVCDVLGLGWTGTTLRHLLPSEKGCERIATPGGPQNTSIINKDGLYRLIFRSDKPIAEDFRTWIIKVVLPAVEKYGVPTAPTAPALPDFTNPAVAARAWADQVEARLMLEAKVTEDAPKVEAFEEFLDADGSINYGAAAKLLKVAPKSLTRGLRDQGILYGNTRVTIAKQQFIDKGYFKHLAGGNNGYVWTRSVLTPKGIEWLRGMYWVNELKEL